ncbi:MAG: hypothetical protein ACTSUD_13435 [Alphaproteobacteria bacterium]
MLVDDGAAHLLLFLVLSLAGAGRDPGQHCREHGKQPDARPAYAPTAAHHSKPPMVSPGTNIAALTRMGTGILVGAMITSAALAAPVYGFSGGNAPLKQKNSLPVRR